MTLKRYIALAGVLLAVCVLWLFPGTREFGYLAVALAFLAALAALGQGVKSAILLRTLKKANRTPKTQEGPELTLFVEGSKLWAFVRSFVTD